MAVFINQMLKEHFRKNAENLPIVQEARLAEPQSRSQPIQYQRIKFGKKR